MRNYIYPARQVVDGSEARLVNKVLESGHYSEGEMGKEFSKLIREFLNVRGVTLVNSGSSANLLALTSLTSRKVHDRLEPGDEVVVTACGFPTTLNPVIQNGLVPVVVDVQLETYVPLWKDIESAIGPRTKAIFMAHTLGNPLPIDDILRICGQRRLWFIEDNCDAFGSLYNDKKTGSFGHFSTLSFYPAHHISTGEGGAVITRSPAAKTVVESFRDWGRDCWCPPGHDNTCGKRFDWEIDGLPAGYDHKYIYSEIGYNLKMTDLQAALGVAQMAKLNTFGYLRRHNHAYLRDAMVIEDLDEYFHLPVPTLHSDPSWFGFCLTIRDGVGLERNRLVREMEKRGIGTRQLFGGNLLRHPAYRGVYYKAATTLENSDKIMRDTFWMGCHPALTTEDMDYMIDTIKELVKG